MADFEYEFEITNWDKYNGRSDVKHSTWFRLNNQIFDDPKIERLNEIGFKIWIFFLCERSKQKQSVVKVSTKRIRAVCKVRTNWIQTYVKVMTECCMLKLLSCKEIASLRSVGDRARTATLHYNTIHNDTLHCDDLPEATAPSKKIAVVKPKEPTTTALVWRAYSDAYKQRYGETPASNAKGMGICRNFVGRLPAEDAPLVASFYLTHNDSWYVKQLHPLTLLLKDAEKLHTEWRRGQQMTGTNAKHVEQASANYLAVQEFLKKREEGA